MNAAKHLSFWMLLGLVHVTALNSQAETVYYALDNVILADDTQMTGLFSWTYDADFQSGVGQFVSLAIPHTAHDESDLDANIDVTGSIEITLAGSVHDDGVDITLVLAQPLTPTTSSLMVIGEGESKYEIGGNGFHTGLFQSGIISPTNSWLRISPDSPGQARISWAPDIPGYVLQETSSLSSSTNWMDSPSGRTNPIVVPATGPMMFYRLARP